MRNDPAFGLLARVLAFAGMVVAASVMWSQFKLMFQVEDVKAPTASPAPPRPDGGLGWLAIVGIVVGAAVVVAVIAGVGLRWRRRRALRLAQEVTMTQWWDTALAKHDDVLSAYAAVETDPITALQLPALFATAGDPASPAAQFLEAFDRAMSLRTDRRPASGVMDDYVAAVDALTRTWEVALRVARRIGLSQLSPAGTRKTNRAIRLLVKARSSDNDFERRACLDQAHALIGDLLAAGVATLPSSAIAALDAVTRLELAPPTDRVAS